MSSGRGYVHGVKFIGGDYVHIVKFILGRGDYVGVANCKERIMSTCTKMSRGDFVRVGYCPHPVSKYHTFK